MSDDDFDGNDGGDDGDDGDFDGGDDEGGKKKKKSPAKKPKKATDAKKKESTKKKGEKKTPTKRKAGDSPATTPGGGGGVAASPAAKKAKPETSGGAAPTPSAFAPRPAGSTVGSAAATGPKEKVIEMLSDSKAKPAMLKYMTEQNRPYSHLQVWENMHRVVKKGSVPKLLDELEAEGKLVAKTAGKAKLYMAAQDPNVTIDEKETAAMDDQIAQLQEKLAAQKAIVSGIEAEANALLATPTDAEADAELVRLEKDIQQKSAKLKAMQGGGGSAEILTQAQVDRIQDDFNVSYKRWKALKKGVAEMVAKIEESKESNAKVKKSAKAIQKKLYEDLGLETDEDAGLKFEKFDALYQPVAKAAKPNAARPHATNGSAATAAPDRPAATKSPAAAAAGDDGDGDADAAREPDGDAELPPTDDAEPPAPAEDEPVAVDD